MKPGVHPSPSRPAGAHLDLTEPERRMLRELLVERWQILRGAQAEKGTVGAEVTSVVEKLDAGTVE